MHRGELGDLTLFHNPLQNTCQILRHFLIRKSDNPKPKRPQILFALCIIFLLQVMNSSIHFHYQISLMAQKVGKITMNNLLSAEVQSIQLVRLQAFPKNLLRGRHLTPQFFRAVKLPGRNFLSTNNIFNRHNLHSPLP